MSVQVEKLEKNMAEKKTSIISPTLITAVVCVLASIAGAVGVDDRLGITMTEIIKAERG